GVTTSAYLGWREDPRLVFVRGDVTLDQGLRGAGLIVVQEGQLTTSGDLEWDGVVVVVGRSSALSLTGSGRTVIRGGAIASAANPPGMAGPPLFAVRAGGGRGADRARQQNP